MTLTAKQMMNGNQKRVNQGVGVADLHANVSGVHNRFGDEFHCRDGDYLYDEFGDLCGVSKGTSPDDSSQDGLQLGTTAKY